MPSDNNLPDLLSTTYSLTLVVWLSLFFWGLFDIIFILVVSFPFQTVTLPCFLFMLISPEFPTDVTSDVRLKVVILRFLFILSIFYHFIGILI